MAFDFGGALDKVLDSGLNIWVDSEKPRPYSAGAQDPTTRGATGPVMVAGQSGAGLAQQIAANPAVWIGGAVLLVLLAVLAFKK